MYKLFTVIYLFSSLFCIFIFFHRVYEVITKKKSIREKLISDVIVVLSTVAVLTSCFNQYLYLTHYIPDGIYYIDVSVKMRNSDIALSLPAELSIFEIEEYEDGHWYSGPAEMSTTKKKTYYEYYLYCVYFGERKEENKYIIDRYVYPSTDVDVYIGNTSADVNIGNISPERLGITIADNFKNQSIGGIAEFFLVSFSGIALILQYFLLDKGRKR